MTPSISASPEAARKDGLDAILADPALIRPVFQPIVDLKRSTVVGFEMLARFAAEPHGTPLEWLAAAERHGMATALEAQLVELGVAARDRLPPNTFLSVNVSPEALLSAEVQGALASATGGLGRLVIEVTEQSRVEDYAELARALARSRAAGAAVAVDDTGATAPLVVEVVAFQWQWEFDYPESGAQVIGTANILPELVLPAGSSVRFDLTSLDVIHSFWIPGFRFKRDVFPEETTSFEVDVSDRTGFFRNTGVCAEFCGLDHDKMRFSVRIVTPDEFDQWLAEHGDTTS